MALNIRSPETEALASELARLTGETKTEAVTKAVRDRLERVKRGRHRRSLADELDDHRVHTNNLDGSTAGRCIDMYERLGPGLPGRWRTRWWPECRRARHPRNFPGGRHGYFGCGRGGTNDSHQDNLYGAACVRRTMVERVTR